MGAADHKGTEEGYGMGREILIAVAITSFLAPFTISSLNVALPYLAIELSATTAEMNWIATGFLISSAVFLIPFGRMADMYGKRKLFLLGISVFSLFSFLSSIALTSSQLAFLRILQGIGGAMIFSTGMAILVESYPINERGKILGINTASVYLGLSLGPVVGGILTVNLGWRSLFVLTAFLGIPAFLIASKRIADSVSERSKEKFDLLGSLLYGISILAFITGSSEREYFALIPVSLLSLSLFLLWERRQIHPVIDLKMFTSSRTFAFSNLAALINYSATFALVYLMSIYLQMILDLDPQKSGFILLSQPAVMAAFSPFAGWLSDRIEPRFVATAGMILNAMGLGLLSTLSAASRISDVVIYLILMGIGFALFSSPNTNAVMSSVGRESYGIASATVSTMRVLGQTLSMAVVMLVFSVSLGNVQVRNVYPPELIEVMKMSFQIFSILCWIGATFSLMRGNIR